VSETPPAAVRFRQLRLSAGFVARLVGHGFRWGLRRPNSERHRELPQADLVAVRQPRRRDALALKVGDATKIEVMLDALNLLNDTASEAIASDNLYSQTFGRPTQFMDPRRVMLGVRLNLGR
jgi:hypothetical protein